MEFDRYVTFRGVHLFPNNKMIITKMNTRGKQRTEKKPGRRLYTLWGLLEGD